MLEHDTILYPLQVADRLGIGPAMLRRYAKDYESVYGELPRDRQGRMYPLEAVERLEAARGLVMAGRYRSIRDALAGLQAGVQPLQVALEKRDEVLPAILAELKRLGDAVERLEAENRQLREQLALPAPKKRRWWKWPWWL